MISCIFIFIQRSFSYLPVNGECACYYNVSTRTTTCSLTCQQQLVEADRLYMCPAERFQQRLPFWRWILAEIFCIAKDKRNDVAENYKYSSTVNYDTPPAFSSDQSSSLPAQTSTLSFGSPISITNVASNVTFPFSYPSISFSSTTCGKMKETKFLIPSSSTCYYQNNTKSEKFVDDFVKQLYDRSLFIGNSNIQFNINSGQAGVFDITDIDTTNPNCTDVNNTDDNCTDENLTTTNPLSGGISELLITGDTYVSSIDLQFYYKDMAITGVNVTIERKDLNNEDHYPLAISINYLNENILQDQYQNRTMKSGNFGYAIGQPVIVLQKGSPQEEPFPVPFGVEGSDSYTPLLFGVDVISGFTNDSLIFLQGNRIQISKLAQGNPEFQRDWVNVSISTPTSNISIYTLEIFYYKIGNVNNPQNIIHSARYHYTSLNTRSSLTQKIFKCVFLKIANNPSHRYLQPNPSVHPIPPDTFYPFSTVE